MPRSLGTSLGLIGRGQEPHSLSLAASSTLCKNATYISDPNASRVHPAPNHAEADVRRAYHADRDCDSGDSAKKQTVLCLPGCHHARAKLSGMDDAPLNGRSRYALKVYSDSFDDYRLLKRRLSTLTHSPPSDKATWPVNM
ncbi:hypothetical protein ASPFODRAFT_53648 [Aspergillus luchuensis CBS 106.47]|uniref:Uncharacterized protein n=1 Tax=Aspergillus luchuensis (strain CBS 106.47) TaxID=1137211 RepID=A0A1M3T0L5_ASPLC|nr:hypothetical protein ASPFODRAFT_53648 [Aspergillus luchuensis CBS 106.47]